MMTIKAIWCILDSLCVGKFVKLAGWCITVCPIVAAF